MNTTPPPTIDRHAEAVAQVALMRDQINAQMERIDELKRDLQTERDRVAILSEERARWRTDAMACRTFVVKLATILEHVNTATVGAAAILDDMATMDAAGTSEAAIKETENTVRENLEKIRRQTDGAAVETVQERTPTDAGERVLP